MRLEWTDSYRTRFAAVVVEERLDERGRWLRLDRSAFYPSAGGQPHDTGRLAGQPVVDVEAEAGAIWHLIGEEVGGIAAPGWPSVGAAVRGEIDWDRRFRHMQRHTAQHLLSQALMRVGPGFPTRSVSMRGADCTLDVAGDPEAGDLAQAEVEVDAAARRNLPVVAFEVEEQHLADYALRRPAKVSGTIRLVAIGDYDLVACGGTHLRSSAEALPIKLLGSERVRGGLTRIFFRAGAEAVADYLVKHAVAAELGRVLSAPAGGLVEQVTRLKQEVADLQGELSSFHREAAKSVAARLTSCATRELGGAVEVISAVLRGSEVRYFEALLEQLQARPATVSILAVREPAGVRIALLAGPAANTDVRPGLNAALAVIGGRGGGRADRAQGAGPAAAMAEAALAAARAALFGG